MIATAIAIYQNFNYKALVYFLSQGNGTFSGDCEILDESMRVLATLDHLGKLTDEEVDRNFYNNPQVNSAIDRLDKYAFSEDSSLIRKVLISKFTQVDSIIQRSVQRWRDRFTEQGIVFEFTVRQTGIFVPEEVIDDVVDSFLNNIYKHAFDPISPLRIVKLEVDQQVEYVLIRICDTGKGISEIDIEERPNGGIRRSEVLLMPYGGEIEVKRDGEAAGFSTTVEIKLLSKESILACRRT